MAYCVPLGIPHSILLGRVPDPGESEWSTADVDKALGFRRYEAERCQRCGTFPWEWPANEWDEPPYLADPYRCRGCAELQYENKRIPTGRDGEGVAVRLVTYDRVREEEIEAMAEQAAKRAKAPDPALLDELGPLEAG